VELIPEEQQFLEEIQSWVTNNLGTGISDKFSDTDWTLIVKLHAMVETALNTAIAAHFKEPALERIIAKLDTSNMATGKVAFAKALDAISKPSATFIQKLSELRNHCVHDIRNFGFTLDAYESGLEKDKRKELFKAIEGAMEPQSPAVTLKDKLFVATITVIASLRVHQMKCHIRDMEIELIQSKAKRLDAQSQSTPTG
jgi:hypothetical protein